MRPSKNHLVKRDDSNPETNNVTDMMSACDLEFSEIPDLDLVDRAVLVERDADCVDRVCARIGRPRRPTRTSLPH